MPDIAEQKKHFKAGKTASPQAADHKWAIIYDPTPGGRKNDDGTTSYGMRFPALILSEYLDEPEKVAHEVAEILNNAEAFDKE